ncbi:hypothetical protein IGI04_038295 [Brassica rapa subsp. trilocularis]|uniref:Uncharacterized protein n=1 Tax=Brassica rapa subsp. trilocularis TaxID=1813537 RepID=A0ABQ7LLG1_BRACM|nr:hypothetical protein IGI04_038295 [Brassica rapa subsp. trilocularis]
MMKKRLQKEKDGGSIDGGEGDRVSSAATGKSGNRIFPVKSSQSTTYEEEVERHQFALLGVDVDVDLDTRYGKLHQGPSMLVARSTTGVGLVDQKFYVFGGQEANRSKRKCLTQGQGLGKSCQVPV